MPMPDPALSDVEVGIYELVALQIDDIHERERSAAENDGHKGDTDGDFVAHHLGGGSDRGEKRPFIIGSPARHDDPEYLHRPHRGDKEETEVEIRGDELVAEGQRHESHENPGEDDGRREGEERLVGKPGDNVFLGKELQPIGHRLQKPVGTDLHGAEAALHVSGDLTLAPDRSDGENIDEAEDHPDRNQEPPELREDRTVGGQ